MRKLETFSNDEEVVAYLEHEINQITLLDECRLYREEQYAFSDKLFRYRNCVEWLIRLNKIIANIKYGLIKSLDYAKLVESPFEENENYRMYSYYLEDSVYRDLVLWDIFRQLLNEFFDCGINKHESISIYKFIKNHRKKIGHKRYDALKTYLATEEHEMVRKTLRNSFTHSLDSTSSYIFHEKKGDKITSQNDYLFPKHPFEYINYIINDFMNLMDFILEIVDEMKKLRDEYFALYNVTSVLECGNEFTDKDVWNYHNLCENVENIVVSCPNGCKYSMEDGGKQICKPILIKYRRIYSDDKQYKIIEPKMSLAEVLKDK